MSNQEYDYDYEFRYEMEPEFGLDTRRLIRIVGWIVAATAIGCVCILCTLVVFGIGYGVGSSQARPEPTLTVSQPPVPVVVFPPEARVGETVTFDGSQSRPGSSPIARYEWDFGDGTVANGAVVTHIYNTPGTYQVTLTVTGQDGSSNTGGLMAIAIIAQLPEPIINLPPQARVGEQVTFDGSQSRPGTSPIASYDWDFGDGNRGSGAVVTHIYNAPAIYSITLTVTSQDGSGNTGGPVQIQIVP